MAIDFAAGGTQSYPAKTGRSFMWEYSAVFNAAQVNGHQDMPGNLGDGSANITPISTNSKIIVEWSTAVGQIATWRYVHFYLLRSIGGGAWTYLKGFWNGAYIEGTSGLNQQAGRCFIDSPSTTSNVRYKLQFRGNQSGGDLHLNRNLYISNSDINEGDVGSYIKLTELLEN